MFRRAGGRWSLAATLRAPEVKVADIFGYSVDMSLDGNTIKVGSLQPRDRQGRSEGTTHIFDRSGATWVHKATVAPVYDCDRCIRVRMSGDGRTLVANCVVLPDRSGRVVTFKRAGDSWVHVSDLALSTFVDLQPLALNSDATRLALLQAPTSSSVDVYRWENSRWVHEFQLRAPANRFPSNAFGQAITFNGDGNLLAIGDPVHWNQEFGFSNTPVVGIGYTGAVFLYERNGELASPWQFRSVVSTPTLNGGGGQFAFTVALSGSGRTLAVGAEFDRSAARGIDGNQLDINAPYSGAAFLY